jgi:hypothetical protein
MLSPLNRQALLSSIAATVADYRAHEIAAITANHVDTWVRQFDASAQVPILVELDHVLKRTYVPKATFDNFLSGLCINNKIAGSNPAAFWHAANFLQLQTAGNSQREMLGLFSEHLTRHHGLSIQHCGSPGGPHIYLDDAAFTGNRVRNDLQNWVNQAPPRATVHVVVLAYHSGGQYYAHKEIESAFSRAGKTVSLTWWRCLKLEDRRKCTNNADVLRPTAIPADPTVQQYVATMQHAPMLRQGTSLGANQVFSSAAGRDILEQEFLKKGAYIRSICPKLGTHQHPLGNTVLQTLGFGATVVTFRNCPNNCPLVFWASDPWYPLFPRKTN